MTSSLKNDRSRRFRFSLGDLLILTAIVAVWIASFLAMRKTTELQRQKTGLLALSSRLEVVDKDQIQVATYPRVADDYTTWEVHVPEQESYELRFAIGEVSEAGMPPAFEKITLTPGRKRITLYAADSVNDGYHFTVFVDGQAVVDRALENDWMPHGWKQASSLNLPQGLRSNDLPLRQLAGKIYTPRKDFGPRNYFNGQTDNSVTGPGYRLWIDQTERSYEPTSPFIGFQSNTNYRAIGLRDGLRYQAKRSKQYEWTLLRPASQTNDPALTIVPEFIVGDQLVLSEKTNAFASWHIRNEPQGKNVLHWQLDPKQTAYSAFLHAEVETADTIEPVIELRWDASRPDDIGFRLASTPANEQLTQWRLRLVGGASHLWRLMDVAGRQLDVREDLDDESTNPLSDPLLIEFNEDSDEPYRILWRSDVAGPLQLLQRGRIQPNVHRGMNLFQGLPLVFEAEITPALQPAVSIVRTHSTPDTPIIKIPGGPVIEEIQIELDATIRDWVWIRAESP